MPEEVFETPQPTQPTEPKTTNWPKIIFAAVLGLGLLAGAAYAGYWYGTQQTQTPQPNADRRLDETPTPTTNPTANWKTYRSEEYKFKVEYPEDWVMNDSDTSEDISKGDIKQILQIFDPLNENSSFFARIEAIGTPLSDLYLVYSKFMLGDFLPEDVVIAGTAAKKMALIYPPFESYPEVVHIFDQKGLRWHIVFNTQNDEARYDRTLDQILSTFKFLD